MTASFRFSRSAFLRLRSLRQRLIDLEPRPTSQERNNLPPPLQPRAVKSQIGSPVLEARSRQKRRSPLTLRSSGFDPTTISRVPDRCQRRTGGGTNGPRRVDEREAEANLHRSSAHSLADVRMGSSARPGTCGSARLSARRILVFHARARIPQQSRPVRHSRCARRTPLQANACRELDNGCSTQRATGAHSRGSSHGCHGGTDGTRSSGRCPPDVGDHQLISRRCVPSSCEGSLLSLKQAISRLGTPPERGVRHRVPDGTSSRRRPGYVAVAEELRFVRHRLRLALEGGDHDVVSDVEHVRLVTLRRYGRSASHRSCC
jgi:hypothetical protein